MSIENFAKKKETVLEYPENLTGWNRSFRNDTLELYTNEGYQVALDAINDEREYVKGGIKHWENDTTEEGIKNKKYNEESLVFVEKLQAEIDTLEQIKNQ